ncbi:MAG: serine/threonine protein kinase [Pseudomonadota bacterium]
MTERDKIPGFSTLLPDDILDAVESCGHKPSGDLLALNSYENRVYRVGVEAGGHKVIKFYRPQRWPDDAIEEEHDYAQEMADLDIPVVPPDRNNGRTLHHADAHRFAVFDCVGGHWPTLESQNTLQQLGRLIGRMHLAGEQRPFRHRPPISIDSHGDTARDFLLDHDHVPESLRDAYDSLTVDILDTLDNHMANAQAYPLLRVHNDLHPGNILQHIDQLHIVDTDDVANGFAVQDLWMFVSGDEHEQSTQLTALLEGYSEFRRFDLRELGLIESLRTLRIMHYAAWLARRWHDPAFQQAFPWFDSLRYWNEHILSLREQYALLLDPPLLTI